MSNDFAFTTQAQYQQQLQRKDQVLTNEFDVVKFIGTVHSPIKKDGVVSEDLKLAVFNPTEKEYIVEQIKDATVIRRLVNGYGAENAERIYSLLTTQVQLMGTVGVNNPKNFLVKSFLHKEQTDDDDTPETTKKRKSKSSTDDDDDEDDIE